MARILIIDDDTSLREVVRYMLDEAGHEVLAAADGAEGITLLAREPDLVISDIRMPGLDGMDVLTHIVNIEPGPAPPVIMLTAHGTVEQAVTAMKLGAFTYLLKPIARGTLLATVDQALKTGALERDNSRLRTLLEQKTPGTGLLYASPAMERFTEQLRRAAPTSASVLIGGESGTGKELAARACHDLSDRWDKPFVTVNCGAISRDLMESELFGHRKGAFTGAAHDHLGRIRAADGGTLFLDEIGELPLELQAKLLRVLESRQVDPVGGDRAVTVDFRLVCASNRELAAEVIAGRFREDLLFRINVLELTIPPLRDREGDIALLWDHFTRLHAGEDLVSEPSLMAALEARPWRGNVRELKNLNQRLVLMRSGDVLSAADLIRLAPEPVLEKAQPAHREPSEGKASFPLGPLPPDGLSLVEFEKELIRRALELNGGNRTRTAAYLGVARHVLVYRVSKYGLA